MEVIIDGIVYVPKENKSELDLLKEKYNSGDYICIAKLHKHHNWELPKVFKWNQYNYYKLIHKKHKEILDAYLADNSVEIEYEFDEETHCNAGWYIVDDFIDTYKEHRNYRLKQQYPIFKRSTNDVVIMLENDEVEYVDCVLTKHSKYIGYRWSKSNFNFSNFETIPYDKERGLYHLQPVFFKGDTKISIGFYSVHDKHPLTEEGFHCLNHQTIEPITPEQLKVMPFVWKMYQQVLKDKQ